MAPYKSHSAEDYENKKHGSYLSRARRVMEKIESLVKESEPNFKFSKLSIGESRVKFAAGFDKLCSWLSPDASQAELDIRHYGDAMYVSFYDRILKESKKRKHAEMVEETP